MKYKIVSDSSANVFELSGVGFSSVPLSLAFGGKEYIDEPGLDVEEMLDEMARTKEKMSSSCPNVSQWLDGFEGADCIFAITITSALSGSFNSAMQAKSAFLEKYPDKKVHVFDSLSAGPEIRLVVEKLCALIEEGLEFSEIVDKIKSYMKETRLLFCLRSLKNLARAGRVSHAKAKIAGVLGIRVIGTASDVGTLEDLFKPRGEEKALSVMYSEMCEKGFSGGKVRISHTRNPDGAEALSRLILKDYPESDVQIEKNAALCSYYAEEGGILVGFEI